MTTRSKLRWAIGVLIVGFGVFLAFGLVMAYKPAPKPPATTLEYVKGDKVLDASSGQAIGDNKMNVQILHAAMSSSITGGTLTPVDFAVKPSVVPGLYDSFDCQLHFASIDDSPLSSSYTSSWPTTKAPRKVTYKGKSATLFSMTSVPNLIAIRVDQTVPADSQIDHPHLVSGWKLFTNYGNVSTNTVSTPDEVQYLMIMDSDLGEQQETGFLACGAKGF